MSEPPAVIVHGIGMARQALAPGLPVLLLSAPGAGAYAGAGWWRALIEAACQDYPATPCTNMLDCATAQGRALEALRIGQKHLILCAAPPVWDDLAARAAACGAQLHRTAPPALDLAEPGASHHLLAWLQM